MDYNLFIYGLIIFTGIMIVYGVFLNVKTFRLLSQRNRNDNTLSTATIIYGLTILFLSVTGFSAPFLFVFMENPLKGEVVISLVLASGLLLGLGLYLFTKTETETE